MIEIRKANCAALLSEEFSRLAFQSDSAAVKSSSCSSSERAGI